MPLQTWQETLIQAQTDGAALTNSTTETSILPEIGRASCRERVFRVV